MDERPLIIDVVDNGGQWTHREWRMLRYLKVDTKIIENTTPVSELREVDGIILSGGAARVGLTGELGNCGAYLELDVPILGICAGHQFMARFYGGDARESPEPEFGAMQIQLHDGGGTIFAGTNESQTVWESHNDEVHEVPDASSSQQAAIRVKYRAWKMKRAIDLDFNSILKSMILNSAKKCSKILLRCVERHERRNKLNLLHQKRPLRALLS